MSPKKHRQVSKGTGTRFSSTKPRPEPTPLRRTSPPPPSRGEVNLRKRIQDFAYQDRFKKEFDCAIRLYFEFKGEPGSPGNPPIPEEDMPAFQEWYFHDYVTQTGDRIIDLFAQEIGPELKREQVEMLQDWLEWNRLRLLEVQRVEPGLGETVLDLLSGEILEVNDISSSYIMKRWEIVLIRPLLTQGRVSFTGSASVLTPMEKPALFKAAQDLWQKYQAQHPGATISDFYRDQSLDLIYAQRRVIEEKAKPRNYVTAEGHSIVVSKATYAILGDPDAVEHALDESEEFVYAGPSKEKPGGLHYNWILHGRSEVTENPNPPEHSLRMETHWMEEPEGPKFRNLGDLTLERDQLELETMSRERLASGKTLLEEILTGLVQHKRDRFTDMDSYMEKAKSSKKGTKTTREEIDPETKRKIMRSMSLEHTERWLNEPIPALDDQTPRQASRIPVYRDKLLDLLKVTSYMEEKRLSDGELPIYDLERIKKELGIEEL